MALIILMNSAEASRLRYHTPLLFQPCTYLGSPRRILSEQSASLPIKEGYQPNTSAAKISTATASFDCVLYFIIFFQGLSHVFATNAIMTSSHFFLSRTSGSLFGYLTMDLLILILCAGKILFLCFSSAISTLFSPYSMLLFSQFGKATVLLSLSFLALFSGANGTVFIVLVAILGFHSAVLSAISFLSIFSMLSQVHARYTHAYYNGQGIAGMLSCCFKLITMIMVVPLNSRASLFFGGSDFGVFLYFVVSSAIVYISAILLLAKKKDFTSADALHATESPNGINGEEDFSDQPSEVKEIALKLKSNLYFEAGVGSPPIAVVSPQIQHQELTCTSSFDSHGNHTETPASLLGNYFRVYREIRVYFWCVIFHFFEVIFFIPNFLYMVKPTTVFPVDANNSALSILNAETFPVITFFFYNLGDVFGRFILRYPAVCLKGKASLTFFTVVSMGFIPLFFFSNVSDIVTSEKTIEYPIARLLSGDGYFLFLVCVFGFFSGYLSLNLLMFVPRSVTSDTDRRIASILCVYGISFALFGGSFISLFLKSLLLFFG